MKDRIIKSDKIITFTILLIILFTSCATSNSNPGEPTVQPDSGVPSEGSSFALETVLLPDELYYARNLRIFGDDLYMIALPKDGGHERAYKYNIETEAYYLIDLGSEYASAVDLQLDEDGNIYVLYSIAPIDMEYEITITVGSEDRKIGDYIIEKFSPEGTSLWKYDITKTVWEDSSGVIEKNFLNLTVNEIALQDGDVYCYSRYLKADSMTVYDSLFCISSEYKRTDIKLPERTTVNMYSLVGDGSAVYLVNDYHPYKAARVDLDTAKLLDDISLDIPDSQQNGMGGQFFAGGGEVYFVRASGAYAVDLQTGTGELLLDWLDNSIDIEIITGMCSSGDQIVYTEDGAVNILTPVESAERTVLTFGTLYLDTAMQKAIVQFNQNSDEYKIEIIDYSQYNTTDDNTVGSTRFALDIIRGDIPDIVELSSIAVSTTQSAKRLGMFADLNSLIEGDDGFSLDDYIPSLITALRETDGSLYELANSFTLLTTVGHSDSFNSYEGITIDELMTAFYADDEALYPFNGGAEYAILALMLDIGAYIDYDSGTCDFENSGFIDYLEFIKETLPLNVTVDDFDEEGSRFREGETMLSFISLEGFARLARTLEYAGGDAVIVGIPMESKAAAAFMPTCRLAISAKSEHKDAAWEFIKYMMTNTENVSLRRFPAQIDVFEDYLEKISIEQDDLPGMAIIDSTMVGYLTPEQGQMIRELVYSEGILYDYDEVIYSIIREEFYEFQNGNTSAEEAAKRIQSRVQTIVSERQ